MGKQGNGRLVAYLPLVVAVTFVVVLAPTLFVLWLRESGAVSSMWVALAIGVVMSLTASQVGAALWKSKANSDLLFNELMLWGWVQRWRSERRLAAATNLLGLSVGQPDAITGGQLSGEEKKRLLTQLTSGLESSDPYTHGHSRRVARHAANIAKQMGLSGGEIAKIRAAGAMHDVGKVETPTVVLHKAGRLTDEEFDIVKRHPVDGADMVATLDDDELTAIVRHHHERLDGTGYPDGLAGTEIPLGARILAVADTFDAITSTRPYRQANPHKKALDILTTEAGTQLDPNAVKAFVECYSGMKPVAFWAVLINARPRVSASLGQAFSPVTGTNVLATTAAAAAVGAVAVGPGAHTVPASSQPFGATKAALISSAPFSQNSDPGTTTVASLLAAPDAKASGPAGRSRETDDSSDFRSAEYLSGKGSETSTANKHSKQAPQDRASNSPSSGADGAKDQPQGGGGGGNAYGHDKPKGNGQGNAYGHDKPKAQGNGNAYGHGKPKAQGNGNSQGQPKGQGLNNGNGQGQSNPNGQAQGNGQGNAKSQGEANGNALGVKVELPKAVEPTP
jgi:HD-GYP domain-containing protein (c-di-GMP phosphodiesterase class II)